MRTLSGKPARISTTRFGMMVSLPGLAVLIVLVGVRLLPESSAAARAAERAMLQNCIECHGRADDTAKTDVPLTCPDEVAGVDQPHYDGACNDYLAWFELVRLKRTFEARLAAGPPNDLLEGERLARQYSCFQCHGELGQGGFQNAGALKGYVPGYFGSDFDALTRGGHPTSIRAWIREGIDPALTEHRITGSLARFFIARQAISMPSFASLPDAEIRRLTNYIIVLHQFGEMDADDAREYGRLTRLQPSIVARHNARLPARESNYAP